jgi:hypothetical protein
MSSLMARKSQIHMLSLILQVTNADKEKKVGFLSAFKRV